MAENLQSGERRTMFQCEECHNWFLSMEVFMRHPCYVNLLVLQQMNPDDSEVEGATVNENTTEAELDVEIKKQEETEQSFYWSKEATLLLIREYKVRQERIDGGRLRKKKAFEEIANELQTQGYKFSADQCAGRLKTITKSYKQIKDHDAKSGNDRRSYAFSEELDDLFGDKPNIRPSFVINSIDSNSVRSSSATSSASSSAASSASSSSTSNLADTSTADKDKEVDEVDINGGKDHNNNQKDALRKRHLDEEGNRSGTKCKKTQVSEVLNYLQQYSKGQEKRHKDEQQKRDERHKERMGIFQQLVEAIKENLQDPCKICMEERISSVFLDCGHMLCYQKCAAKMRQCPVCREQIIKCVKVYKC